MRFYTTRNGYYRNGRSSDSSGINRTISNRGAVVAGWAGRFRTDNVMNEDWNHEEQIRLEPELSEPAVYIGHEQTEDDLIQEEE